MSPRTTIEKVRAELEADGHETKTISDPQIKTVGIGPAHLIVTEDLENAGLSNERLALIERYLAGHLILSSGVESLRQVDDESLTDGSSQTYSGDRDYSDYRSTSLGQKAVAADPTGTLAETGDTSPDSGGNGNKKPPATIAVPDARGYDSS